MLAVVGPEPSLSEEVPGVTNDPTKCSLCGYPRRVCQCVPPPPVRPIAGWQCPVCKRVWAPFMERCTACKPRRMHEVLDPLVPRETTTLRHGMTVALSTRVNGPEKCSGCRATFGGGIRWFSGPEDKPLCFACTKET